MQIEMFQMVNQEREKNRFNPLIFNPKLEQIALKHCQKMIEEGKLEHEFPGYPGLNLRLRVSGIKFLKTGENIAYSETYQVSQIVKKFLESPGHRANILKSKFTDCGIGICRSGNNYYITQIFIHNLGNLPLDFKQKLSNQLISVFKKKYKKQIYYFLGGEKFAKKYSLFKISADNMKFFKNEIPGNWGYFYVYNVISNNIDEINNMVVQKISLLKNIYSFSIGIKFLSNIDYPNGVYSISTIFFQNKSLYLSYREKIKMILDKINSLREKFNHPCFNLTSGKQAQKLAKHSFFFANSLKPTSSNPKYYVISYSTADLELIPPELRNLLFNNTEKKTKIKIGIFEPLQEGIHINRVYVTVMIRK